MCFPARKAYSEQQKPCGVFSLPPFLSTFLFQPFQDHRCHVPDSALTRKDEDNIQMDLHLLRHIPLVPLFPSVKCKPW